MATKRSKARASRPPGRPPALTPELQEEVCNRVIMGETIRQIAASEHMPAERTIYLTLAREPAFAARYAEAREIQCIRMEDELLEISDDGRNDWMARQTPSGETVEILNHEHIQRSKVRVDTRKWLMSKRLPKKYGDRITQEHTGKDGGPIETKEMTEVELGRRIAFVLAKGAHALKKLKEKQDD